jgi:hypothetical protein
MDGMYEEAVLTYRRRLTQHDRTIFPRRHMSTFRNAIQASCTTRQKKTVSFTKNGSDLRTSVTIRLNKKDVNADAVSEQGRKAAEVDSLLIPIDIQIDDEVVTRNVMVYSVTIKHNRTDGSVYVHRLKEARPQSTTLRVLSSNRTAPC